jgi:small subunit ribosomal protein S20
MANIKSAQKKARKDVTRANRNKLYNAKIDTILNTARKTGFAADAAGLNNAYATIDKAAKRNIISAQKAARIKSKISAKK